MRKSDHICLSCLRVLMRTWGWYQRCGQWGDQISRQKRSSTVSHLMSFAGHVVQIGFDVFSQLEPEGNWFACPPSGPNKKLRKPSEVNSTPPWWHKGYSQFPGVCVGPSHPSSNFFFRTCVDVRTFWDNALSSWLVFASLTLAPHVQKLHCFLRLFDKKLCMSCRLLFQTNLPSQHVPINFRKKIWSGRLERSTPGWIASHGKVLVWGGIGWIVNDVSFSEFFHSFWGYELQRQKRPPQYMSIRSSV